MSEPAPSRLSNELGEARREQRRRNLADQRILEPSIRRQHLHRLVKFESMMIRENGEGPTCKWPDVPHLQVFRAGQEGVPIFRDREGRGFGLHPFVDRSWLARLLPAERGVREDERVLRVKVSVQTLWREEHVAGRSEAPFVLGVNKGGIELAA